MPGGEAGVTIIAIVALVAGLIRGFTGFGGPAFMLAILTIFYAPLVILGKILVVDFAAGSYLFYRCLREIKWKDTLALAIPTMLTMPIGQWLLHETDPLLMRRAIAITIVTTSILMLLGLRYKKPFGLFGMAVLGFFSGVVFGATYIALVAVAGILLGPYNKFIARTLIISWAFLVSVWYAIISTASGATVLNDVWIALPGALLYFAGVYMGSRLFQKANEERYRKFALAVLLILSFLSFLN